MSEAEAILPPADEEEVHCIMVPTSSLQGTERGMLCDFFLLFLKSEESLIRTIRLATYVHTFSFVLRNDSFSEE